MSTEEINQSSADGPGEPAELAPESAAESTSKWGLNRRKFLTAAALGTAAAAFLNKGSGKALRLGPASAFAHDISGFQCTANDVRIQGPGQIINEPCNCSGTFTATVQFTVINNAASARNCITLHLCPVMVNGQLFDPGDVQLQGSIAGKSTSTMFGTIANYPCGAGLVCFGSQPAAGAGEVFAKGEDCPTGQCCSTITWRVPGQDPDCDVSIKLIGSKCRHQQICIQGRGSTTLDCDTSAAGVQRNCTIACGTSATIRACTSNASGLGPFKYELFSGNVACNTTATPIQTVNSTSDTCRNFSVGPLTATTSYTCRITDKDGCAKCDTVTLTVSQTPAPVLSLTAGPDCAGNATITVTNCDSNLTYVWSDGGNVISGVSGCTLTRQFSVGSHSISATASQSGACPSPASNTIAFTVNPPISVSLGAPQSGCNGVVTLTATATGGNGNYTFSFSGASGSTSGNTFTLQPQLNGQCRTVTASVTDSAGCTVSSDPVSFSQCVTTTTQCPHPNA